jgi:hypothetical protein
MIKLSGVSYERASFDERIERMKSMYFSHERNR